jgi:4-amino-4-deoxy-L-arabinose transferase-like glycosyltransferase
LKNIALTYLAFRFHSPFLQPNTSAMAESEASSLGKAEKRLLWLATILVLASLFINLGIQPVYLEEPRRAMVAMEMEENGNFIVPTQLGEYYYAKPPLFNWVIWASAKALGGYSGYALRLPTALSLIAMSLLLFALGRRYVNLAFGWYAALLFPTSIGLYFYFSLLGEIDLFYSMLTLGGFAAVFHYQQQGQYWRLFAVAYALAALGTLTKGFPSVVFLALSLLPWLWQVGELKRLFSWQHLLGILVFAGIVGGYALAYHRYNDIGSYLGYMLEESGGRTAAKNGGWELVKHFLVFPLEMAKDLPPGLLLLVFALRQDVRRLLARNPYLLFAALVFLSNYLPYWLSPGARQRYIYMLYPLVLMIGLYAYQHRQEVAAWRQRVFGVLAGVLIGGLALGCLALLFIPSLSFLPYRLPLSLLSFAVLAGVFWRHLQRPQLALVLLIIATAVGRLVFDLAVLPQRAREGGAYQDLRTAEQVAAIVGAAPFYLYADGRISFSTIFHLNRLRGQTLRRSREMVPGAYYLFRERELPLGQQVVLPISYKDTMYVLVRLPALREGARPDQ